MQKKKVTREYVIIFFGGIRKTKKLTLKIARYLRKHKYDFAIAEIKIRRNKKCQTKK